MNEELSMFDAVKVPRSTVCAALVCTKRADNAMIKQLVLAVFVLAMEEKRFGVLLITFI